MAVAFESVASNHGDGATLAIDKPSGLAVGDLMLAHVLARVQTSPYPVSVPAGWTRVYRRPISGSTLIDLVAYKVATAADVAASNFTFSFSGAGSAGVGTISRYSGVHQTKPLDSVWVDAPVASGTTLTCPSQTPRYATALAVAIGAGFDDVTASGWADSRLGNTWTERYDVQHDGASYDLAVWAATCPLSGKEPSGQVTATLSGACVNGGAMILLAPTTSTGTPERFNYCANPKAELDTATWSELSTSIIEYFERHAKADAPGTPPAECSYVFKVKNLTGKLAGKMGSGLIPVAVNDVVTLQAVVCSPGPTPLKLGIQVLDKNMASLGFVTSADFTPTVNTWQRHGASLVVTGATAAWAIPHIHNNNGNAVQWFTMFEAECQGRSGRHPEAYRDGDSTGCEWVGARHASTSRIKTHPWRRNLIANPRVANDLTGWTGNDASTVPERITNPPVALPSPATACVRWKKDGGTVWKAWGAQIAMRPGLYYHMRQFFLWAANGGSTSYPTVYVRPEKADQDGSDSARFADEGTLPRDASAWLYPSAFDVNQGNHQWLGVNGYAGPSPDKDQSYCWLRPRLELYSWSTQYIYTTLAFVDQEIGCLEASAYCAHDWQEAYRDGDSDDWEWDGTAHASASREKTVEWTSTYIRINDDAASTDDNDVALTLHAGSSAGAVAQMRFSDDGETFGDWVSYATSRAYQLPAVSDESPHTATVYVQFKDAEGNTSPTYSDSITLQIDWTLVELRINGGAPATFDLDVSCRFRGFSSASSLSNGIPSSYRIRETDGAWSGWATFTPDRTHRNRGWMTVPFAFAHASEHTVEVMLRDDDLNTITTTASIDVIGVADSLGGAAAPVDITNWRLQLGTTIDVIDALDAPPKFNLGEHGPGSLQASIPVEHPLRRWANELTAGEDVKLWDGTLLLWDGKLKPSMPVSGDESSLIVDAAGPLDLAKQDASYLATFVDADPAHWTISSKASKAFGCDTEGGPSIKHTKGRGVEGGSGAGVWYWVNAGKRNVAIDHLEFSDASSIDVDSAHWFARLQVAESPWSAWTTVKEWNNETLDDTAIRVPATAGQSFAEAGYANVYAVKILLVCDIDLTAADSANTRWVELADPQVFVNVDVEPSVDEALASIAADLGYADQVVEAVGTDLSSLAFFEQTTRAAAMEQVALMHPGEVEWCWRGGIFYCRPKPTAPDDRTRWYVIDSRRCEWGVVSDEARRVDYVAVTYQIKGHATIPQGTPQVLYRPSTPTDPTARVGALDMTENGPMTTTAAQDAGDQWLRWNDAQAQAGQVSGFGGSLRTVDGLWVPSSHARNGDWIQPLDLFDVGPLYITAVEVNGIEDVVLNIGGSERDYAYRPRPVNVWRRNPMGPRRPHHPRRPGGRRTSDG
jgi:hypothetical protein